MRPKVKGESHGPDQLNSGAFFPRLSVQLCDQAGRARIISVFFFNCEKTLRPDICDVEAEQNVCSVRAVS